MDRRLQKLAILFQETDYLGVINHFYDSDAEDDEDEENQSTKMDALNKELEQQRVKKLAELRVKKQEFTPGLWNAQAVLLGGLGKDPDVEGQPNLTVRSLDSNKTDNFYSTH